MKKTNKLKPETFSIITTAILCVFFILIPATFAGGLKGLIVSSSLVLFFLIIYLVSLHYYYKYQDSNKRFIFLLLPLLLGAIMFSILAPTYDYLRSYVRNATTTTLQEVPFIVQFIRLSAFYTVVGGFLTSVYMTIGLTIFTKLQQRKDWLRRLKISFFVSLITTTIATIHTLLLKASVVRADNLVSLLLSPILGFPLRITSSFGIERGGAMILIYITFIFYMLFSYVYLSILNKIKNKTAKITIGIIILILFAALSILFVFIAFLPAA